jgi:hypothetical protein
MYISFHCVLERHDLGSTDICLRSRLSRFFLQSTKILLCFSSGKDGDIRLGSLPFLHRMENIDRDGSFYWRTSVCVAFIDFPFRRKKIV